LFLPEKYLPGILFLKEQNLALRNILIIERMNKKITIVFLLLTFISIRFKHVWAKIYQVGPAKTYTLPSQVASLVANGDTVNIDAGNYIDCASWNASNLLLRGIGGYAHVKDKSCGGKGIWITSGNNITIEYIEFSGASVPDNNGAGIRAQGGNITIRHCYFHDNENGILASDNINADVLIEYSEFANNGFGDGFTHNMYINHYNSFSLRYCYIHHSKIGHEIKSRAHNNYILYNRISDETSGTSSRNIDLPNGGQAIIIGNLIEQGPNSGNSNILGFGLEGLTNPGSHDIYVINNTFVNDKSSGSFINIQSGTGILKVVNNIFAGPGTLIVGIPSTLDSSTNRINSDPSVIGFINLSNYDYRLSSSSIAIGKGSNPGNAGIFPLVPVSEYMHTAKMKARIISGIIDIGAYEYTPLTAIVQSPAAISSLTIYPNPNKGNFALEITILEEVVVKILSETGREVYNERIRSTGKKTEYIDVSGLPGGIYMICISDEKLSISKKIIIIN
jgi:hypothetical protein